MDAPDGETIYRSPASGDTATLAAAPVVAGGPFAGGGLVVVPPAGPTGGPTWAPHPVSPFSEAYVGVGEADTEALATEALLAELEDEEFEEAVEGLVNEAAARHLTASPAWSSEAEGGDLAGAEVDAWAASLESRADRYLEQLERELGDRPLMSLSEDEIGAATARVAAQDPLAAATEDWLGNLVKSAVGKMAKVAKGAVATGLKAVKGIASLANIMAHVRKLMPSLLKKVVAKAKSLLPANLQGPATQLAQRLGIPAEAESSIAAEFDQRLVATLLAPDEATADGIIAEAGAETESAAYRAGPDPVAALDAARARFVTQLAEAEPGVAPVAAVEQFLPAVVAPLRLIVQAMGRSKIVNPASKVIATLIEGIVGKQAASTLAPVIADVGLRMVGLEAEGEADDRVRLGAEALAATVEDTIRDVATLPEAALREPLRLQAEIEQAFTEAAARHLPRRILRPDLAAFETDDEEVAWVAMPRATRPVHRYRKAVPNPRRTISRPRARVIVLAGEDTLEERLLDAGVRTWPAEVEVELYEALPGAHLGHLAAFEVEGRGAEGEDRVSAGTDEFEELTPEVASRLLGQPGLAGKAGAARAAPAGRPRGGRPLRPGQRVFRLVIPGTPVRRRRPRLVLRFDVAAPRPSLRVHVRLTEREADGIGQSLARNAQPEVVGLLRGILGAPTRRALAARLDRQAKRRLGAPLPAGRAAKLAEDLAEAMLTSVAKELPSAAATLAAATRDPAAGVTLTFAFSFADRAAVSSATPEGPTLTIRPGERRD